MEMTDTIPERKNEAQSWLQNLKEYATFRQRKKDTRKKARSILEEENERLRSLLNLSSRGNKRDRWDA